MAVYQTAGGACKEIQRPDGRHLPGYYADEAAVRFAFQLADSDLNELRDIFNTVGRPITLDALRAAADDH